MTLAHCPHSGHCETPHSSREMTASFTSSTLVTLVLGLLLAFCAAPSPASADGSIQPFYDEWCLTPLANASRLSIVSSPECQYTKDSAGTPIAFTYNCDKANFTLAVYHNATYCGPTATYTLQSMERAANCPVATYQDADNYLSFYASVLCSADREQASADVDAVSPFDSLTALEESVVRATQRTMDRLRAF